MYGIGRVLYTPDHSFGRNAMTKRQIPLGEAKARLSELVDLAEAGEPIVITRHGKPVLELIRPRAAPKPIDVEALRRLTAHQPRQRESTRTFIRRLRESARY